jgi:hypothetical protein
MNEWTPTGHDEVRVLLACELERLHPVHRSRFQSIAVPIREVPVTDGTGEKVIVVAEHAGKVVYYSDIEDGWEIDMLNDHGGIAVRGSNQFELSHLMWQLFGAPEQCE